MCPGGRVTVLCSYWRLQRNALLSTQSCVGVGRRNAIEQQLQWELSCASVRAPQCRYTNIVPINAVHMLHQEVRCPPAYSCKLQLLCNTMSVPRSRIVDLMRVQCRIFNATFNPLAKRLGNKILRQRLRGPSLAAYYPRRVATFVDLKKLYPGKDMYDEVEEDRLEHLQIAKSRGKGAPKKKRTATGECRTIRYWMERTRLTAAQTRKARRGGRR